MIELNRRTFAVRIVRTEMNFLFFFNEILRIDSAIFRHLLRVSIWNNVLTAGNHEIARVNIVLSEIDWSKENARDYPISK